MTKRQKTVVGGIWVLGFASALLLSLAAVQENYGVLVRDTVTMVPGQLLEENTTSDGRYGAVFRLRSDIAQRQLTSRLFSVYEDGRQLGPAVESRTEVDRLGNGRFAIKSRTLSFSASDGTDPRTNGRVYSFRRSMLPGLRTYIILGSILLVSICAFVLYRPARHSFANAWRSVGFAARKRVNMLAASHLHAATRTGEHAYRGALFRKLPDPLGKKIFIPAVIVTAMLASVVFTSWRLDESRDIARLSTISNYDDVVYLNSASRAYFVFVEQGTWQGLKHIFSSYLHSPFAVLLALLGYGVFGLSTDSVYLALSLVVLTLIVYTMALCWRLPPVTNLSMVLFVLTLPFATMAAVEFRPDMMWATVLSGSCVYALTRRNMLERWQGSVAFGVCIGLALLTKPSTFLMTLLVAGGSWFLVLLAQVACRKASCWLACSRTGLVLLAILLTTGWHLALHGEKTFNYFWENSFGANKDVWVYGGSAFDRWFYYLKGGALESNMGSFFIPCVALFLVGAGRELSHRDLWIRFRGGSLLWMLAALWFVNGYFNMKSPFLGGAFYGFLIFGSVFYFAEFMACVIRGVPVARTGVQMAVQLFLLAGSITVFLSMVSFPPASRVDPQLAENNMLINHALLKHLSLTSNAEKRLLFTQGNPVVPEYLELKLREKGIPVKAGSAAFVRELERVVAAAEESDYVFAQDPEMLGRPGDNIPGERSQVELVNFLTESGNFELDLRVTDLQGKSVYLFKRVSQD